MESEPLSALNLSAWQAKGKKGGRESGNGNGSVGKETKQKLRKWQVRAKMESCPDLLVGVVPAFVCQSNIQLLHRFACLCVLCLLSSVFWVLPDAPMWPMFIAYQLRACPGAAVICCPATCKLDTYWHTEKNAFLCEKCINN